MGAGICRGRPLESLAVHGADGGSFDRASARGKAANVGCAHMQCNVVSGQEGHRRGAGAGGRRCSTHRATQTRRGSVLVERHGQGNRWYGRVVSHVHLCGGAGRKGWGRCIGEHRWVDRAGRPRSEQAPRIVKIAARNASDAKRHKSGRVGRRWHDRRGAEQDAAASATCSPSGAGCPRWPCGACNPLSPLDALWSGHGAIGTRWPDRSLDSLNALDTLGAGHRAVCACGACCSGGPCRASRARGSGRTCCASGACARGASRSGGTCGACSAHRARCSCRAGDPCGSGNACGSGSPGRACCTGGARANTCRARPQTTRGAIKTGEVGVGGGAAQAGGAHLTAVLHTKPFLAARALD